MGDDDHGQIQFAHQPAQQIEQAGLHRYVEPAGGFVHEHQSGAGDQIAGDLQALLHAAGKSPRQVVDALRIDLHLGQPVQRGTAQLLIIAYPLRHQTLADIGAGRHAHAQTIARILFDKAPLGAQQRAPLRLTGAVQVEPVALLAAIVDAAAVRRATSAQQREQRGFPRAGLANDAQHFTGIQIETDVLTALLHTVQTGQTAYLEQRLHSLGKALARRVQ